MRWEWKDGTTTTVAVVESSRPEGNACIGRVLKLAQGKSDGHCLATVLVGKAAEAEKAAAAFGKASRPGDHPEDG